MTDSIDITAYSDALVVLGTAGVVVPVMRRLGLHPILGYLAAGAALGPLGLGTLKDGVPVLWWLTVVEPEGVAAIADLGVVFLLFLIGLELSFARLATMRKLVFGLGLAQVVTSAAAIGAVVALLGTDAKAAAVIGACLALSSTAMVVETLSGEKRIATAGGRTAFAVLLAQDLSVVPIFLLISALAGEGGSVLGGLAAALGQAAVALAVIAVAGRLLLRPLFRLVATLRSPELFMAAILFVIVGTGVVAARAGVSMALGAFVAGVLLAETEYRKAIQSIIEPFKGLLLGVFFFSVGMGVDPGEILREPVQLVATVAALVVGKGLLAAALARLFGVGTATAAEVGMMLGPAGEFAFVGLGVAVTAGVVGADTAAFVLTAAALSMALVPPLVAASRRAERWFAPAAPPDVPPSPPPQPAGGHTLVVGHGRVGKVVCSLLAAHGRPYLVVDSDALAVARDRLAGHDVHYGDAATPAFLLSCGIADAAAVVVTVHEPAVIDAVVGWVRVLAPEVPVFARARDGAHARHLYGVGVTDAVPETVEASLQLSETVLVGLGVPMGPVIASIHDKRDEFRRDLREAARRRADPPGAPSATGGRDAAA